ncbi:hypothetical protein Metbo_1402 [Methanobacterium lacus]|uniref:Uncharacterized protein n=1 Tax=Methanobacterium lacus (strain AL-21) TaxID=877455 RepID=F0T816_METLA|nr:hypothetical protein [Methanobacterium lacus]ADZ09642.1 hypothetical protein Metbo_1402 [Methanobacterium lacus]
MKIRPIMGILIICLMLQYSMGGLCANAVLLNDSQGVNNSVTVSENTTANKLNATAKTTDNNTTVNNTTSNYNKYPLNCPKWEDYKDKYSSPITSFKHYLSDLEELVKNFKQIDDNNVALSKANYENNTGYFSGNPVSGDTDYRYMPTSELNEAYGAASLAKSRITIANSLSTSLQSLYTIISIVLGIVSGILGVITAIAGAITAASGGGASPFLIVCITFTAILVATTIAIGTCTVVMTLTSSGINEESSKIENRLVMMNAELIYRATLPVKCTENLASANATVLNHTNMTDNSSTVNQTFNNTTVLNTSINMSLNLQNLTVSNGTKQNNTNSSKTNSTNGTVSKNIIGINDVSPSTAPIPGNVTSTRSGTYLDEIYNVDLSGLPQEPSKPHPKWYQFWKWIEYGAQYVGWIAKVAVWGINHTETFNIIIGMSNHIIDDSMSLND